MNKQEAFAVKLPSDLKKELDAVTKRLGLRKNFVVEEALREKIEDLLDAYDLRQAMGESTGFHAWSDVKKSLR